MNPNKLRWLCRRGVRELDVLFTEFLDTQYADLDLPLQAAFQHLLQQQDPQITDWLFDRSKPEDLKLQQIISRLQQQSGL